MYDEVAMQIPNLQTLNRNFSKISAEKNFSHVLRRQEIMSKVLVENIRILFMPDKFYTSFTCNYPQQHRANLQAHQRDKNWSPNLLVECSLLC